MGISALVISNLDRFVEMRELWDMELSEHVDDPYLFSCLLIEHWKIGQKWGWHPFLIVFTLNGKIVGFAPLMMRSSFGFKQVCTFDQYTYPNFFFDKYREVCVDIMVSFLFRHLKCKTANIVCENGSANERMLKEVCRNRGFSYSSYPQIGQAFIATIQSIDSFRHSLKKKDRKKFAKIRRKLDELGSWHISRYNVNSNSIAKIWAVERFSWKDNLEGKEKALKNWDLEHTLSKLQNIDEYASFFDPEIWTLELNGVPLSYILAMKRNKTVFFAKTSYDARYKHLSPGLFLMNDLIERVFTDMMAEKIDFMTALPFMEVWKPRIKKRSVITISSNQFFSKAHHLVFENRLSRKLLQTGEKLRWQKRLD